MKNLNLWIFGFGIVMLISCAQPTTPETSTMGSAPGLRIAFVNADSILYNYAEFRTASDSMDVKQRKAEAQLQAKGADLEKDIIAYQRKAQSGTMSRLDMESTEKKLGARQEELIAERDQITDMLRSESAEINNRLQKLIHEKLEAIRIEEGYDYIMSYVQGGPILVADAKHDITPRVLKVLNASSSIE